MSYKSAWFIVISSLFSSVGCSFRRNEFCNFVCSIISGHSSSVMKSVYTILLLLSSNVFMTFAWYGHLKLKKMKSFETLPILSVILISWGIGFFEYIFQVPANRIGYKENGGPFTLMQLKVMQEVITLIVFTVFSLTVFKNESFKWNHLVGFVFLVFAVYFIFKK